VRFFGEKGYSLSVAPKPLVIWNKKLESLESSELKKLKIIRVMKTTQDRASVGLVAFLLSSRLNNLG
jgi:hypothetical protein